MLLEDVTVDELEIGVELASDSDEPLWLVWLLDEELNVLVLEVIELFELNVELLDDELDETIELDSVTELL